MSNDEDLDEDELRPSFWWKLFGTLAFLAALGMLGYGLGVAIYRISNGI